MPCLSPLSRGEGGSLRRVPAALRRGSLSFPCGYCFECRKRRKSDWSNRLMHELRSHERACFVTLTYSDEHLPPDGSLHKREWQLFAKRLREAVGPFRFYAVGEYGEATTRPHFHAIIFGHDFLGDAKVMARRGEALYYTSPTLERVWGKGFVSVSQVNRATCNYVAGYVFKKHSNRRDGTLMRVDPTTGEVWELTPEFSLMSRRPGIGHDWLVKYFGETYRDDYIIVDGNRAPIPRGYDAKARRLAKGLRSDFWDRIVARRLASQADRHKEESGEQEDNRLAARERIGRQRQSFKPRGL